jgi:hypothetical protein
MTRHDQGASGDAVTSQYYASHGGGRESIADSETLVPRHATQIAHAACAAARADRVPFQPTASTQGHRERGDIGASESEKVGPEGSVVNAAATKSYGVICMV